MKSLFATLTAMSLLATSATAADPAPSGKTESAIIGGGCFWCVEAQYKMLKGVNKVVSGYAGGHVDNPTYQQVCEKFDLCRKCGRHTHFANECRARGVAFWAQ